MRPVRKRVMAEAGQTSAKHRHSLVTRHKIDDGAYEVRALGMVLGKVTYNRDAWSWRRWFIDGCRLSR